MARISMKNVREIRNLIYRGHSVKEVASIYNVSETTVRNYTKEVRKRREEELDRMQLSV